MKRLLCTVVAVCVTCGISEGMGKSVFLENKISDGYKTCWSTVADAERWVADMYSDIQPAQSNIGELLNTIIDSTRRNITDAHIMVSMLWSAIKMFAGYNYDALKICSRKLDKYADNSYKLAENLLLAQSTGNSIESLAFDSRRVNTSMISDAIGLLRTERNGHSLDASKLLQKLGEALDKANMGYLLK